MKQRYKIRLPVWVLAAGLILVIALVGTAMILNQKTGVIQASPMTMRGLTFQGSYKIGDGDWTVYTPGDSFDACGDEITLRGRLYLKDHEGLILNAPVVMLLDHLNCEIYMDGQRLYRSDCEHPQLGNLGCGKLWSGGFVYPDSGDAELTFVLHNPHRIGNTGAVDAFLENLYIGHINIVREAKLEESQLQQTLSTCILVLTVALFGMSLFATLVHTSYTGLLWMFSLVSLCAGGWFYFDAQDSANLNNWVVLNTTGLEVTRMLYGLFASGLAVCFLSGKTRRIGSVLVGALGAAVAMCIVLPAVLGIRIYDMKLLWMPVQAVVGVALALMLIFCYDGRRIPVLFAAMAAAMLADMVLVFFPVWRSGGVSQVLLLILFVCTIAYAFRSISVNAGAVSRARKLELELEDQRTAIMLSQIQPHFIYNTLTTISWLCSEQPEKAAQLTEDFSLYLRGNFGELENRQPVPLNQELQHVKHYVSIENVRFPDMQILFDISCVDFCLPALTIQPLVENAIKHGLMKLETGGTVLVRTFETPDSYCVTVTDNGVGFDEDILKEDRKHIGLRNIRTRLQHMCGGTLTVQSEPGAGTVVTITIPKEETR